jgi:uncharacterized protein
MRRAALAAFALILVCLAAGPTTAKSKLPKFSAPVVDAAGVLDESTEAHLDAELNDYQARTTNQIAVAIVKTTGDDSIEDYAIDLARSWEVGLEGKDNGVVLVLAIDDRKMRIEVGRGLEGDLTDLESGRIIRDVLRPRLQDGDYAGAVRDGVQAIRYVLGDTGVAPPSTVPPEESPSTGWPWFLVLIGGLSLMSGFVARGTRRRWGMGGPIIWGGGFGGGGFGGSGGGFGGGGGGFGGGGGGGFGGGGASGGW